MTVYHFKLLLIYATAFMLISCEEGLFDNSQKRQLKKADNIKKEQIGDKSELHYDPSIDKDQSLKGSTQSDIENAEVVVPPGSLSVNTVLSLGEGAPLGTEVFFNELNLDEETVIVRSAPAVILSSSEEVDPIGSLKISVPMKSQTYLTEDDEFSDWAIFYKIKVAETGEYLIGFIPRSDFTVADKIATFETEFFGSYQAVELNVALTDKLEAKSSEPIKTKEEHLLSPEKEKTQESVLEKQRQEAEKKKAEEEANEPALAGPTSVVISDSSLHGENNIDITFRSESTLSTYVFNLKACTDTGCSESCVGQSRHTGSPATIEELADGTIYYACVQIQDEMGNLSNFVASRNSVEIDTSGPSVPQDVSISEGAYISTKSITINFTPSVDPNFDTHYVKTCSDAQCSTGCSSSFSFREGPVTSFSNLAEGTYYACVQGVDLLGNLSVIGASGASTTIDITDPTAPANVLISDSSPHNSSSLAITFDSGSDLNFKTHNVKACTNNDCTTGCVAANTANATSGTITGLQDGSTYYACVQAEDQAGLVSAYVASAATVSTDLTAPTVSSVSATANDNVKAGETVSITISFSETVSVSGSPQLKLETGTTDRYAVYASGSGSSSLSFSYTVQAGDTNADLDYVDTSSLELNGGSITDDADNNATLILPTPGASGSLGINSSVKVDTTNPTTVTVTNPAASTTDGTVNATWIGGTDDNFSTFNVKACTSSDCSTACVGSATASSSPQSISGLVVGSSYYVCVESVDDSGNSSGWAASSSQIASQEPIYGDGSDGSKIIISNITNEDTTLLGGRTLAASRSIIGKGTWSGSTLELTLGSSFTNNDFDVGDEILWTVVATGTSPTDCGTTDRGKYGFADITAIDVANDKLTIDEDLSFTPNNDSVSGTSFCHVLISRVPEFENLTINNGFTLSAVSFPYNTTSNGGGILAIKVSGTLTASGTATISVAGGGFAGGSAGSSGNTFPGNNISKYTGSSSSSSLDDNISNGGGGAYWWNNGGGGGGSYGAGGDAASDRALNNGGTDIQTIQGCSGTCDPETTLFFGGGGGNGYSKAGGNGGGILIIYADSIAGSSDTLNLSAHGADAGIGTNAQNGSGGGAGGAVFLKAENISGLSTLNINASGGDASTNGPDYIGGAGGGGLIYIDAQNCASSFNPDVTTGSVGQAGSSGQTDYNSSTCS